MLNPTPATKPNTPGPIGLWIIFCTFCSCTGWILSAVHQLNATGYAVTFGVGVIALALFWKKLMPRGFPVPTPKKLRLRFSHFFPAAFALLAAMAILGGFLHRPSNPDGLTQRIPHLLNWLAEGRWHWIENAPPSFNAHAVGFEWLMAPMLSLLKTDRWIFLYNAISFLLLPGLLFSLFTRLRVTPRAAWYWMWLVPAGYCFLTQAGGIGNDTAGAIVAIAAVDFALRAKKTGKYSDVWLSILSASLLSGMKMSNLALGLPWLVAIWPSLGLLLRRPLASGVVATISIFSSALPLMFLMHQNGGGWTGAKLERGLPLASPLVSLAGNGLNLGLENVLPPVFPMAGWWNEHVYRLLPASFIAKLERSFEPGASHLAAIEIQYEICAGVGFGLTLLLLVSWLWARFCRRSDRPRFELHLTLVRWSPFVSLLAFMLAVDVSGPARIITPYYCLLMPLLLTGRCHEILVRRKGWRGAAALTLLIAAGLLIINPPRPLWPARTILNPLSKKYPRSSLINRAAMLYEAYAERWDALAPIRNQLPPNARNIGFIIVFMSGSTMETSLWRPFGQRRIWHLPPSVSRSELEQKGIRYMVVGTDSSSPTIPERYKKWIDTWLVPNGGKVIAQDGVKVLATAERQPWYVIEMAPSRE
jgi:hypothetical protein